MGVNFCWVQFSLYLWQSMCLINLNRLSGSSLRLVVQCTTRTTAGPLMLAITQNWKIKFTNNSYRTKKGMIGCQSKCKGRSGGG